MRQGIKFHTDSVKRSWVMAIWRFFKMVAVRQLVFLKSRFLHWVRFRGSVWVIVQNFVAIDQTVAKIFYRSTELTASKCVSIPNFMAVCQTVAEFWQFSGFSKWRLSAIIDI